MATIKYFLENRAGHAGTPAAAKRVEYGKMFQIENYLDFTQQSCAVADVVQALKIPAGFFMTGYKALVLTAEGEACVATVGDTTGVAAWDAQLNLNSASATVAQASLEATDTWGKGRYYATATTIDLVIATNTANVAKVWIAAQGFMVERYAS